MDPKIFSNQDLFGLVFVFKGFGVVRIPACGGGCSGPVSDNLVCIVIFENLVDLYVLLEARDVLNSIEPFSSDFEESLRFLHLEGGGGEGEGWNGDGSFRIRNPGQIY